MDGSGSDGKKEVFGFVAYSKDIVDVAGGFGCLIGRASSRAVISILLLCV